MVLFIAPKFNYQMIIIRAYVKDLNSFYTTSFSILKKEQATYEMLFEEKKVLISIVIIL